MTPHEKAVNAINARLERLQVNLHEAKLEPAQRFLFQSLVVTVGVAEALNDYLRAIGKYAERRHAEIRQTHEPLQAQHAAFLASGKELLERLKANPNDRGIRQEIEVAQRGMEAIQKTLRRGANALQRELSPSVASIDLMATTVKQFSEADQKDALKRVVKTLVAQVRDFYRSHPLPTKNLIDAASWEAAALTEIEQSTDFYDAYARTGFQATFALELLTLAVSENPPATPAETTTRGHAAAAERLKAITARFTSTDNAPDAPAPAPTA